MDMQQSTTYRRFGHALRLIGLAVILSGTVSACGASGSLATPTLPFRTATPFPTMTVRPAATVRPTTPPLPTSTSVPALPTAAPSPTLAPTAVALPSATVVAPSRPRAATFSAENAYRHVEELSISVGIRAAGSEAEVKAADYIAEQLGAMGYQISRQRFTISTFQDKGSRLNIDGDARTIETLVMQFSGSGRAEGLLMVGGQGSPSDFQNGVARGKIVLVERGNLTFQEKVKNAKAGGAVAVVIYNNVAQSAPMQGDLREAVDLPVIAINRDDGNYLKNLVERRGTVRARVETNLLMEQKPSFNVQAVTANAGSRRPIIVVGGHYDSVPAGPGANDNASGIGVMLELARLLAREQRAELRFVAFGAEEVGLIGSRAYVDQLTADERGRIVAMLNLDMVAVGPAIAVGGSDDLVALTLRQAEQLQLSRVVRLTNQRTGQSSDHVSFIAQNIPAVFIHRPDDPNYHTGQDRAQFVQPKSLQDIGTLSLYVLDQLIERLPA